MMYASPNRAHDPPARRARRADAVLDARAGRVPGHVRARVGDGRARDRAAASTRSSCASATSPRSIPRAATPFSSRNLVALPARGRRALRLGRPRPGAGARRDGAGSSAPASRPRPTPRAAAVRRRSRAREPDGSYLVQVAAADIGTGARTVLTQIAADALDVPVERCASSSATAAPEGAGRGRLDGHGLVGLRRRQGLPAARSTSGRATARRTPTPSDDVEADEELARHALRRAVRRGARRTPHTGEIRVPRAARRVRRRRASSTRRRPARSSSAA